MANNLLPRIVSGGTLQLLGLSCVALLLLGIDFYVIQPAFLHLEVQQATEDGNRVKSALDNEIGNIGNLSIDWASWDDTYIFAQDHNRRYIESNYPDPSYLSKRSSLDLFAVFDIRGKSLVQGCYHPDMNQRVELDIFSGNEPAILNILAPVFKNEQSISGLLNTRYGIIALSAHPILTSQNQGPSRGTLVMGRFLTQARLDFLAERVKVQFDLLTHGDSRLTPSEQAVFSSLVLSPPESRQVFRQDGLYQLSKDIENNPVMLIRSQPRGEISTIGQHTRILLNALLLGLSFLLLFCLVIYRDRIKVSESALQDSENRYRTIFTNDYTVMLLIDPATAAIVDANPAAHAYYGYNIEEMKNKNISEIHLLSREEIIDVIALARSRKKNRFIFKHRKADGTTSDVEVFIVPLTIKGKVLLFSIVHDISERKQAEKVRLDFERQIQQAKKVESLGRMAGAIAHHYNNLLTVVMGNLELAMKDLSDTANLNKRLTAATAATHRASEICKLMLAYLGQTGARQEPLDLTEVCRQSLHDLQAGMPENVSITPVLPAPGPIVNANAEQIKQIVGNLLYNAFETMSDNPGVISLTVRTISPTDIPEFHRFPIGFQPGTVAYACLEVKDEGNGIVEHDIEKICDPFFSTKFTGRGLGLPVVLGAVKAHEGCLTIESVPDQGSIFRVFLPLSAEPAPQHKPQDPSNTITLEGRTILVVEDDPIVRDMVTAMLTHMGMTVLKAEDGVEAVEIFKQNQGTICCVLSDLTMPRMDGWQTLAALRQIEPGIPFIMTSGYNQTQVMEGDHPDGPQTFLRKPYEITKLKNALVNALEC